MPENPESEGSRLITLKQIELEHGVSRSALHTYRRSASFPQPVPVEGSTKTQYRADEVAAWFEANPKQQGKKRDQFVSHQQGEPVTTSVDPRITALTETVEEALKSLRGGYHHLPPLTETTVAEVLVAALTPLLDEQRAAVLREADEAVSDMPAPDCSDFSDLDEAWESGASAAARRLREMASDEEE